MSSKINWDALELRNWIGADEQPLKRSSRKYYKIAFATYFEFSGMTAKEHIDEAEREETLPKRARGITKRKLIQYHSWLRNKRELAPKTANAYLGAIRGFYRENNYPVAFKRSEIPKAHAITERKMLKLEDVKKLLTHAFNQRDKTIIMCLYQSGMDISTLLSLKYIHIKEGLKNGKVPLMFSIIRPKTGQKYRTFFGNDATTFLKNYLMERKQRGETLKLNSSLFVTEKKKIPSPLTTGTVQKMFRSLVVRAGLMTEEEMNYYPINPCGPHALRESFSKIATAVGLNKNLIDYLQGHKTDYSGVYSQLPEADLENAYRDLEPSLTVSKIVVPPMEQLRETARGLGIDLDILIERKGREYAEGGMGTGGGFFPNLEDPIFVSGLLQEEIKRKMKPIAPLKTKSIHKIVKEDELEVFLADGWRYVNSLNNGSGKCIVTRS